MILRLAATVDGRVAAADGAPPLDPTFVDSMVEPLSVRRSEPPFAPMRPSRTAGGHDRDVPLPVERPVDREASRPDMVSVTRVW